MNYYLVKAYSSAAPAVVYRLLISGKTWPDWMAVESYEVESGADPASTDGTQKVGDVRVFRAGKYVSHESIVELLPDRRLS